MPRVVRPGADDSSENARCQTRSLHAPLLWTGAEQEWHPGDESWMKARPVGLRHASSSEIIGVINIPVPAAAPAPPSGQCPAAPHACVRTLSGGQISGATQKCWKWKWKWPSERPLRGRMNAPLCLLTFAQLVCAAGAGRVSVERLEEGIRSGRRTCRLYCRVGIGFHLQIHPDGRVNGSHEPNQLSVLELFAVSQGVIGIKGVYSNRFLAMNNRGRLHATEWFTDDCKFRERFQENSYNTYASVLHRNHRTGREWFVALNKRGKAKMGSSPRVKSQHVSTHFLPRVSLDDSGQQGFTITDRSKERRKNPPLAAQTPALAQTKANIHGATTPRRTQVKYWPKYRFG
ncbi:fibroblast growth factor 5 [Betta splendens]|uniref:Fibroblast growth factor n=1 Tax=Betta splendens TaxID=158456 RepID=A0A6P7NJS8_BETSP|nr:fibroblast growth factor 5 [Betta splendens]